MPGLTSPASGIGLRVRPRQQLSPITPERFQHRFEAFCSELQQSPAAASIPEARRKPAWPAHRKLPRSSPATATCW